MHNGEVVDLMLDRTNIERLLLVQSFVMNIASTLWKFWVSSTPIICISEAIKYLRWRFTSEGLGIRLEPISNNVKIQESPLHAYNCKITKQSVLQGKSLFSWGHQEVMCTFLFLCTFSCCSWVWATILYGDWRYPSVGCVCTTVWCSVQNHCTGTTS